MAPPDDYNKRGLELLDYITKHFKKEVDAASDSYMKLIAEANMSILINEKKCQEHADQLLKDFDTLQHRMENDKALQLYVAKNFKKEELDLSKEVDKLAKGITSHTCREPVCKLFGVDPKEVESLETGHPKLNPAMKRTWPFVKKAEEKMRPQPNKDDQKPEKGEKPEESMKLDAARIREALTVLPKTEPSPYADLGPAAPSNGLGKQPGLTKRGV